MPEWKSVIDLTGDGDSRVILAPEPTEKNILQTTGQALKRLKRRLPGLFDCPDFVKSFCAKGYACEYKHDRNSVEFQEEMRARRRWDVFIGGVPGVWGPHELQAALESVARNGITVRKHHGTGYGFAKFDDPKDVKAVLSRPVYVQRANCRHCLDVKPYDPRPHHHSHGSLPLKHNDKPRERCVDYQRGKCWRQNCLYLHANPMPTIQRRATRPLQSTWCTPPSLTQDYARLPEPVPESDSRSSSSQPGGEARRNAPYHPTPSPRASPKEDRETPISESRAPERSKPIDLGSSGSKSSEQPPPPPAAAAAAAADPLAPARPVSMEKVNTMYPLLSMIKALEAKLSYYRPETHHHHHHQEHQEYQEQHHQDDTQLIRELHRDTPGNNGILKGFLNEQQQQQQQQQLNENINTTTIREGERKRQMSSIETPKGDSSSGSSSSSSSTSNTTTTTSSSGANASGSSSSIRNSSSSGDNSSGASSLKCSLEELGTFIEAVKQKLNLTNNNNDRIINHNKTANTTNSVSASSSSSSSSSPSSSSSSPSSSSPSPSSSVSPKSSIDDLPELVQKMIMLSAKLLEKHNGIHVF